MWKKKEEKKEEKEKSLLKELCGDDAKLYDFLSVLLYENPLAAISKKDLEILIEEAEKSGNYWNHREALDKALFEATQNPGERGRYIKVIQDLARASAIENHKFMSERIEDIIDVASKFYNEKLVELGENGRREARRKERELD